MKLRHNVLLLLAIGIALLTVAMPVSAQLNVVPQNGVVLLGEEGLNVTNAVEIGTPYIAWWDSSSSFDNPPDRVIDLEGYNLANFNIDDDETSQFVGTEGKGFWWRLSSPGETNPTEAAFQVVNPQAILMIRNLDRGTDVTNGNALIKDILDFQLSQSTLHYIFLRNNTSVFDCKIVVKSPNGVTYSQLWTPSSITDQSPLIYLPVNSTPWYWSSYNGNAPYYPWGWNTGAINDVTSLPAYSLGTYQVTIECNQNNLGFVGQTRTITLEEEAPEIIVSYEENKTPVIRGDKFYTTITKGIPNEWYIIWIKDCAACPNGCCTDPMTGTCCDQPPMIVEGQEGVFFWDYFYPFEWDCDTDEVCNCSQYSNPPCIGIDCNFCKCFGDGGDNEYKMYHIYDTLIKWCGCLCTKTLYDLVPHNPSDGKYYYALVKLDSHGERTVEWQTSTETAPTTYKIHTQRWEEADVCEIDITRPYDEACVEVEKGEVTIETDVCDEITDVSYLGETVHIYGKNTDSATTYLFFKGPCQSCSGENMTATNAVENDPCGNGTTFTRVPVKPDGTWEYYWYTRNLQIDLGQYTIYASSMPNDAPALEGVPCTECEDVGISCAAWDKASFTFLEPTLIADVNPKIIQIICCSGPSITVDGEAMGLRGEALGQDYNTIPIGIWVFGENKVAGNKYIFEPVIVECSTGEFSVDLKNYFDTLDLVPGTYTVVVQHPMYNHRLDIIPESRICDQSEWCPWLRLDPKVLVDEVWYPDTNRKFVATASPVRWSKLFVIDGPDRLAGTAALNALLAGFEDPNIDDKYVKLTFKVESNNALQAGFSGTPTSGAAPLSVFFTDISIGYPETWHWDFGDGYTSEQQNPTHIYENVGTYSVTLTVTGATGSSSVTKNAYVTVTTGPTQTGTVTPTQTIPTPSTMNLYSGWNFISTPRALADGHNTASSVFTGVNTG